MAWNLKYNGKSTNGQDNDREWALRSTSEFGHRKLLPWLIVRKGNEMIYFPRLVRDCTCHLTKCGEDKNKGLSSGCLASKGWQGGRGDGWCPWERSFISSVLTTRKVMLQRMEGRVGSLQPLRSAILRSGSMWAEGKATCSNPVLHKTIITYGKTFPCFKTKGITMNKDVLN